MMRARYQIQHEVFTGTVRDDYGETVATWAPPVDVKVFGINFPSTAELVEGGHDREIVDKVLLVPPSLYSVKPRDRFIDSGETFEVIGEPETAKANPFGWNAGGRVKLRKVAG